MFDRATTVISDSSADLGLLSPGIGSMPSLSTARSLLDEVSPQLRDRAVLDPNQCNSSRLFLAVPTLYDRVLSQALLQHPEFSVWDLATTKAGYVAPIGDRRAENAALVSALNDSRHEIASFRSGAEELWTPERQVLLGRELERYRAVSGNTYLHSSHYLGGVRGYDSREVLNSIIDDFHDANILKQGDLTNTIHTRITNLLERGNDIFGVAQLKRIGVTISSVAVPGHVGGFHGHHSQRIFSTEFGDTTLGLFKPEFGSVESAFHGYGPTRISLAEKVSESMAVVGRSLLNSSESEYVDGMRILQERVSAIVDLDLRGWLAHGNISPSAIERTPPGIAVVFPKMPYESREWPYPKDWVHSVPYALTPRVGIIIDYSD